MSSTGSPRRRHPARTVFWVAATGQLQSEAVHCPLSLTIDEEQEALT